ncbi:MAG TPA: MaoC family dehydratase [Chloroflexota bacterium]|nr:MaoC family dehydratase [Chloroflexota bacterium]
MSQTDVPRTVSTIDELRALTGQEIGVGPWFRVTQEQVDTFAELTGDHQWIHVDPERAAASPLGGTIAHGFFTLALLPRLSRDRSGVRLDLKQKMGLNYGLNRVRFPAPVRVGRRIRLRTTLLSVEELSPNEYQVSYRQAIEVEGQAKPAMVAETLSRLYF